MKVIMHHLRHGFEGGLPAAYEVLVPALILLTMLVCYLR
jgi:hypothetical protein